MRTGFQNRPGIVYDPTKLTILYAEDAQSFVDEINLRAPSASPTFTGTVIVPNDKFVSGEKFSRSFVITNPTANSDLPLWRVPVNATITAIHLLCKGNVTVGQLWEFDANGLNGATVDSSDITGVVDTNVNDDGTLSNPGISANNYLGWKTTSVIGTPTYAIISFEGYYN